MRHLWRSARPVLVEIAMVALILILSSLDAVGFYLNLAVLLYDQPQIFAAVIVAGCAVSAVVLPFVFGLALVRRRMAGGVGGLPTMIATGIGWALLACVAAYVRVTFSTLDSAGGALSEGTSPNTHGPGLLAILMLIVYLTTGVVAWRHACDLQHRWLVRDQQRAYQLAAGQPAAHQAGGAP